MSINMNDGRWTHDGCPERHTTNMGRLECELAAAQARVEHLEGALRDNEQAWTTCNAQRDRAQMAVAEQRGLRHSLEAELADAIRTAQVWRHYVEVRDNQLNGVLDFLQRIEAIYLGKPPSWVESIRGEIARHQVEPTEDGGQPL